MRQLGLLPGVDDARGVAGRARGTCWAREATLYAARSGFGGKEHRRAARGRREREAGDGNNKECQ